MVLACVHVWVTETGVPSKSTECDWCILCAAPRPGYLDPREKWKTDVKPCKDCTAEGHTGKPRETPHPGPRCVTHHRAKRKADKERRHAKYVGRTYNLGDGEYARLVDFQDGVCYICRRANGKTRKLSTDHDHACCSGPISCGRCVRGALCRPCNDMLGHGRDSVHFFVRAIDYLENPPMRRMRAREERNRP